MIPAVSPGSRQAKPSTQHKCGVHQAPESQKASPQGHRDAPPPLVSGPRGWPGWSRFRRGVRRRAQRRDQLQDVSEHVARDGNLGHLESDVSTVTDDRRADVDELLA